MPKVESKYLEEKRNAILDAAFQVCMKKPVYAVTMKDIILETGFSHGLIYKYFSNIDEVFTGLVNREAEKENFKNEVESIMKNNCIPEEKIKALFDIIKSHLNVSISGFGKIQFELSSIYINDKERLKYYEEHLNTGYGTDYLITVMFDYISEKERDGYFKVNQPLEQIFLFVIASLDGIVRDSVLVECYEDFAKYHVSLKFDSDKMIDNLYLSLIYLLGVKE